MCDPRGTVLLSDEAAIGTARTIIDDLLEDSGPGQPRPIIMVRNEAGEISIPQQLRAAAMPPRRFPPPWTINEMNGVCFVVRDKNGQQLG